jgi:hypothetical protein
MSHDPRNNKVTTLRNPRSRLQAEGTCGCCVLRAMINGISSVACEALVSKCVTVNKTGSKDDDILIDYVACQVLLTLISYLVIYQVKGY